MPVLLSDITSVSTTETSGLDASGYSRPMVRTSFKVRGQGPYHVDLPKDGWTADAADAAIHTYAEQLIALRDKYPGA
jgi:hypothetical protein